MKSKTIALYASGLLAASSLAAIAPAPALAASTIENGEYVITSHTEDENLSGMNLASRSGKNYDARYIAQYSTGYDAYQLIDKSTMSYLTLDTAENASKLVIGDADWKGCTRPLLKGTYNRSDLASYWTITKGAGDDYIIKNKATGYCLTPKVPTYTTISSVYEGSVFAYASDSDNDARWSFSKQEATKPLDDGEYMLTCYEGAIEVPKASPEDGKPLGGYAKNNTPAQKWNFKYNPEDFTYTVTNVKSGKTLDVADGIVADGAVVQQRVGADVESQRWYVTKIGKNYWLQSKKGNPISTRAAGTIKLDPAPDNPMGGGTKYTNNIVTYDEKNPFDALKVGGTFRTSLRTTPGTQKMADGKQGFYTVDITGGNSANKTNVQLWQYNTSGAQMFVFEKVSSKYFVIKNALTGKCLDVAYGKKKRGTNVWQYKANGSLAQQWEVRANKDGSYTFISRLGGLVLDLSCNRQKKGANIQVWNVNGSAAQRWWVEGFSY